MHTAIGLCHIGYGDCLLAGSGWFHPDSAQIEGMAKINHKAGGQYYIETPCCLTKNCLLCLLQIHCSVF